MICSNNPILVLQNVPRSVDKIEMDNNPFIEIDDKEVDSEKKSKKKLDYLESINEYFRLKNEYEKVFLALKRKAYQRGRSKKEKKRKIFNQYLSNQIQKELPFKLTKDQN